MANDLNLNLTIPFSCFDGFLKLGGPISTCEHNPGQDFSQCIQEIRGAKNLFSDCCGYFENSTSILEKGIGQLCERMGITSGNGGIHSTPLNLIRHADANSSKGLLVKEIDAAISAAQLLLSGDDGENANLLITKLNAIKNQVSYGSLDFQKGATLGLSRFVDDWAPLDSPLVKAIGAIEQTYQAISNDPSSQNMIRYTAFAPSKQLMAQEINAAIAAAKTLLSTEYSDNAKLLLSKLSALKSQVDDGTLEFEQGSTLGLVRFAADWAPLDSPIIKLVGAIEKTYQALSSESSIPRMINLFNIVDNKQLLVQKIDLAITETKSLLSGPDSENAKKLIKALTSYKTQVGNGTLQYAKGQTLGLARFVADWAPLDSPLLKTVGEIEQIYQNLAQ
jgi:hypothetical protein